MYVTYFGLERDPFALTPDPRFLFLSERHREALAHLLYGLGERGGFVQLTGEVGTGKTTLCRSLLNQVPDDVDIALILNPRLTVLELLSSICDELQVPWPAGTQSVKVLVDILNRHLLDAHASGRRTVLIIDEAQQLSADVLEQVRLLTNLETPTAKLLQIILIGQPELQALMARSDLRQLSQRITARYHLLPLSAWETTAYVLHRLRVAGCKQPLFSPGALKRVHRLSGGVPRLINVICDRALLGAYARDRRGVSAHLVSLAGQEVSGRRTGLPKATRILASAAIALCVLGVGGWGLLTLRPLARHLSDPIPASVAAGPQAVPSQVSKGSLEEWLSDDTLRTGPSDANNTLLRRWGITAAQAHGETLSAQAAAAGLAGVEGRGDWEDVEPYNRPASLELVAKGRTRYAVLVAVDGGQLLVDVGGVERKFPREEVNRCWTGRFSLLWKEPPGRSKLLRVGSQGPEVVWVRQQLDLFEGRRVSPKEGSQAPVFDRELRKRVEAFQRSLGLWADGRVGPRTFVQLSAYTDDSSVPSLRPLRGRS